MPRVSWIAVFLLACVASQTHSLGQETPAQRLSKLLDEAWEFDVREDPLFATFTGDQRFADKLPRETLADQQRRLKVKQEFLARAKGIDRATLPRDEQINLDIFTRLLANEITEYEFKSFLTPITNREGFHTQFPELGKRTVLKTVRDYEQYIARLAAFDQYAADHIELMREGIKQGFVLPSVVLNGVQDTLRPHIVEDPAKSLLYSPFNTLPEKFTAADKERLTAAAKRAIAEGVVPGYRRFLKFLEEEYLKSAREAIGASALPGGREFYRHRIRKFTTLDLTPEQVHATGLAKVKRIRGEMDDVRKRAKFEGDHAAFVAYLRTDAKFYPETPERLMKEVAYILKRMDGELPKLFKTLPRAPYGIREIPLYIAPRTTTAYYTQPSGDGTQAGFYYVNTYNLKSRPLFEMEALSLHEAVPGHHLQLAIQQELGELPKFRRFAGVTAFIEGWGLYAERLGLEVGFYQDPYSDFGRLSFEMWRACRLVVDTGMHYLGWTRKQAIDFMAENTALSLHNIEAEVDRYISWPGQAVAYKTGELKIRELRALAERELGAKFDVREFHDVVLGSGSIPLSVLDENVRGYVERVRVK